MNELPVGLYWSDAWRAFFYKAKNTFMSRTGTFPRVPWHWAEYHAYGKRWFRCSVVPAGLERSSALQFLLVTGEVFKPDLLEEGIETENLGVYPDGVFVGPKTS